VTRQNRPLRLPAIDTLIGAGCALARSIAIHARPERYAG
jgi:hypothetical protein